MQESKIATQILAMLDDKKRRSFLIKLWVVIAIVIVAWVAVSQWESPLAVMPQTLCSFALGSLYLYAKAIGSYPRIRKYFDIEALEQDAKKMDPTEM